jgi:hypothetical protein
MIDGWDVHPAMEPLGVAQRVYASGKALATDPERGLVDLPARLQWFEDVMPRTALQVIGMRHR